MNFCSNIKITKFKSFFRGYFFYFFCNCLYQSSLIIFLIIINVLNCLKLKDFNFFKKYLMKLDILAFAAHPDDTEISCAGTLKKHIHQGKKVGVIDLTGGELGSRGSKELRLIEAQDSSGLLGLSIRENLHMADGFFQDNFENQLKIIEMIRKYQPEIVICNSPSDRHPDHGRAGKMVAEACFYSGLIKIQTKDDSVLQNKWRPQNVFHYIQDHYLTPDFIVDITPYMDDKMNAIKAFSSQFYDENSAEPETPISGKDFFDFIQARAMQFGRLINVKYGEGFIQSRPIGVEDITKLL